MVELVGPEGRRCRPMSRVDSRLLPSVKALDGIDEHLFKDYT